MFGIQNNIRIRSCDLPAELVVRHRNGALGSLGSRRSQSPAQLGNRAVEVVLREKHVADQAERDAGHVLAVAPERDIGEMRVRVRAGLVAE